MHPEKIEVEKIQNGRLSAIIHLDRPDIVEYHENRSRYLHHYYKTNCNYYGLYHNIITWLLMDNFVIHLENQNINSVKRSDVT